MTHEPKFHYDRVTSAWTRLLGDDLHYGLFDKASDDLSQATTRLTLRMAEVGCVGPDMSVLDVGCGTGAPACFLARQFGARITGITTSGIGLDLARARATTEGLTDLVSFERGDGTNTRFGDESFERVWVLESSHLMRDRAGLIGECARVLRPSGRWVLCDIMLQRQLTFAEVRRLRAPLMLLRDVFGDAHMEPLSVYRQMAAKSGLTVDYASDLTAATRPTFAHWRTNANHRSDEVTALIGEDMRMKFCEACAVLEHFWDGGILGYGILSAVK